MSIKAVRPGVYSILAAGALALGCSGSVTGSPQDPGSGGDSAGSGASDPVGGTGGIVVDQPKEGACATQSLVPPVAPLRRLTRREYNNTVRDLLFDTSMPAQDFVADARPGLFDDNAGSSVTALLGSQYQDAANSLVATAMTKNVVTLIPCSAAQDDACARSFIADFGKKAFRRPLTDAEKNRFFATYSAGRTAGDSFNTAISVLMSTFLQSPKFINHIEGGDTPGTGLVRLTSYERASRLSYFLWGSMPDDALFAAADANELETAEQIEAQARRMIADLPKALPSQGDFFAQWLRLDKIEGLTRDMDMFPKWLAGGLRDDIKKETEAFIEDLMWKGDHKMTTLLTAPYSFVNANLAAVYGLKNITMDSMSRTNLDVAQRAGILTQASWLAIGANFSQTSPVRRGVDIRRNFLCQDLPPPPPGAETTLADPIPGQSTAQRLAQHRTDPKCSSCHDIIDPIGLGFENYDAIGAYRTTDSGVAIVAAGELTDTRDVNGPFTGAVELAGRLSRSGEARECMVGSWVGYATGAPRKDLHCAVSTLLEGFTASDTDMKELIVAITRSDAFLVRPAIVLEEGCQ